MLAGDIEEGDAVPLEPYEPCSQKRKRISPLEDSPVEPARRNANKDTLLASRKAKAQAKGGKKNTATV